MNSKLIKPFLFSCEYSLYQLSYVIFELSSCRYFLLDISMIYEGVCSLYLTNHAIAEVTELQHGSYHFYWMMEHPFMENYYKKYISVVNVEYKHFCPFIYVVLKIIDRINIHDKFCIFIVIMRYFKVWFFGKNFSALHICWKSPGSVFLSRDISLALEQSLYCTVQWPWRIQVTLTSNTSQNTCDIALCLSLLGVFQKNLWAHI